LNGWLRQALVRLRCAQRLPLLGANSAGRFSWTLSFSWPLHAIKRFVVLPWRCAAHTTGCCCNIAFAWLLTTILLGVRQRSVLPSSSLFSGGHRFHARVRVIRSVGPWLPRVAAADRACALLAPSLHAAHLPALPFPRFVRPSHTTHHFLQCAYPPRHCRHLLGFIMTAAFLSEPCGDPPPTLLQHVASATGSKTAPPGLGTTYRAGRTGI